MEWRRRLVSTESFVSIGVFVVAVGVLIASVDVGRSLTLVLNANPVLYVAAFFLYYVPFLIRGERWRLLLKRAGVDVGVAEATEVTFLSFFVNNIVPAQLGDVYRGHLLGKRREESRSMITGTVFADRVIDLMALLGLVTSLGYVVLAERFWTVQYVREAYLLVVLVGAGIAAVVLFRPHRVLPGRLEKLYKTFVSGVVRSVGRDNAVSVVLLTGVLWSFVILRVYLVSLAVDAGFSFSIAAFLAVFMILVTIMPLTPAGLGVVEVLATSLLAVLAVDPATTLSVVLLDRTITFVSVLVVGGVYQVWTERDVF